MAKSDKSTSEIGLRATITLANRERAQCETLRNSGQYELAFEAIKRAIEIYRGSGLIDELSGNTNISLSDDVFEKERTVVADYAESLGRAGGLQRRLKQLQSALDYYREGATYEKDKRFAIDDSYNTVNHLVVQLEATGLKTKDLADEISEVVDLLRIQTRGPRIEESWAHADYALCLLLAGNASKDPHPIFREVEKSYRRFVKQAPLDDIESAIRVLRGLTARLVEKSDPAASWTDRGAELMAQLAEAKRKQLSPKG